jgi:hypothetical protein
VIEPVLVCGIKKGETGSGQEIYWSRICAFGILVHMCGERDSLERNALFKQEKKVSR